MIPPAQRTAPMMKKILEKEKELFNEYIAGFGLTEDTFLMWQTNTAIQKKSQ